MSFEWLNKDSIAFLTKGYLKKGQDAKTRFREIAETAEAYLGIEGFANKFYHYLGQGFYSLSSPVIANFGNDNGLPISCNGSFINDSIESMAVKHSEIMLQTKYGAGTSAYFGDIRPRGADISDGSKASGPVHYMRMYETVADVISQGSTRRGALAAYLPVDHPDIMEFLELREEGNLIQNISIGVTVPDYWLDEMIEGDAKKRKIWARVIRKRKETGYPYIFFSDTVNRNKPQVLKDNGYKIYASNLCSEIALPSSDDWSFVCNLSSMNCVEYDNWKDTDAVEVMTYFLDAVMSEYLEKVSKIPLMAPSYEFAKHWRAVGIGQLGWHSYLQSKSISFEDYEAIELTEEISRHIEEKSHQASREMAAKYGEPAGMVGTGMRNLTTCAIAPTTSSSAILGQVSPSIEPLASNYYTKDLAKGSIVYRNPYLKKVLEKYGQDTEETWYSILENEGSVQHLDFLTEHERNVFKCFHEINPMSVIYQAAVRQMHIDQSQSVNLMIPFDVPTKTLNNIILEAWKLGVKTLYYQRSTNVNRSLSRAMAQCVACEA